MPKSLRVMGKRIDIQQKKIDSGEDGLCVYERNTLMISPDQTPDNKRDTVLHELTHWLDHQMQAKMSERQVGTIATALLAALRDNPALVAYLTAD